MKIEITITRFPNQKDYNLNVNQYDDKGQLISGEFAGIPWDRFKKVRALWVIKRILTKIMK